MIPNDFECHVTRYKRSGSLERVLICDVGWINVGDWCVWSVEWRVESGDWQLGKGCDRLGVNQDGDGDLGVTVGC